MLRSVGRSEQRYRKEVLDEARLNRYMVGNVEIQHAYPIHMLQFVEHHEAVGRHAAPAHEEGGPLHAQPLPTRAAAVEGVQRAVESFFLNG